MNAGDLNRRVAIDRNFATQDSSGDPVADWQELATVWAQIVTGPGQEGEFDKGILAESDVRIHVLYSPLTASLTAKDRLRYGGRIYNIVDAQDVNAMHVEVLIAASAGLNDG